MQLRERSCFNDWLSWYHIVKNIILVAASVLYSCNTFRRSNMGVMYFGGELETCQSLSEVRLKGTDHHEHKSLRVATQGELQQICKLKVVSSSQDEIENRIKSHLAISVGNMSTFLA